MQHDKRYSKAFKSKKGKPPGTLTYTGIKKEIKSQLEVICYNPTDFQAFALDNFDDATLLTNPNQITWINIIGVNDLNKINEIGKIAHIHPLTLEDILNVNQRPKVDIFESYLYINIKVFRENIAGSYEFDDQNLGIILSKNFVITLSESNIPFIDNIKKRVQNPDSKIRKYTADYLAYSILDTAIDEYYSVLERLGEEIETLEQILMTRPTTINIQQIYSLKKELLELTHSILPVKEIIIRLEKDIDNFVQSKTVLYLSDLFDHIVQIIETAEIYRDLISDLIDMHLSITSNRLNEIIKVLTILSSIFIPLTFIAGVYGMNFKHMPELEWNYGYFISLGLMVVVALSMLFFFKKRKWL